MDLGGAEKIIKENLPLLVSSVHKAHLIPKRPTLILIERARNHPSSVKPVIELHTAGPSE